MKYIEDLRKEDPETWFLDSCPGCGCVKDRSNMWIKYCDLCGTQLEEWKYKGDMNGNNTL